MTDCGEWHERLALRLYEELEPAQELELENHLSACGDCRDYVTRLRSGLGRLTPPAWVPGLRSEDGRTDGPPREHAPRWTTWRMAAGFAAGILLGFSVARFAPSSDEAASSTVGVISTATTFRRSSAPPPAATANPLSALETWLDR